MKLLGGRHKSRKNNDKEEVKRLYKEETTLLNNVKSSKETKIRKENTMVKKDESSEPVPEKEQQMPDKAKNNGLENENEKGSINKVLKSNPGDSSMDIPKQILNKNTEKNRQGKENMESTTKETYTRSPYRAMEKIISVGMKCWLI
jgi:hypothetical protein